MTAVFLTIDTEIGWRHHVRCLDREALFRRSVEPAGVGLSFQLALLARYRLKATFFVDPMPALVYGLDVVRRMVEPILAAGQEVQLHLHPNWTGARFGDAGQRHARFELVDYSLDEQRALIGGAAELLVAAGAPAPVAFRAGSYGANDATLDALAALGLSYDSSHNGAERPAQGGISLAPDTIAPVVHRGVVEVPVTVIEDQPGTWRTFQLCALSIAEARAALDHAIAARHEATTIVGHSFELANRAGTRPNMVHVRRFEALCAMLDVDRTALPTCHFADRPPLALDRADAPLPASALRRRWRQAEQLWSNWIEERAA